MGCLSLVIAERGLGCGGAAERGRQRKLEGDAHRRGHGGRGLEAGGSGHGKTRALPLPSGTLVCPAQQPYDGLTLQALGRPGARAWSCQELGCLQRWGLASGTSKKPHPQMFGPFPSFWIVCSVSGL